MLHSLSTIRSTMLMLHAATAKVRAPFLVAAKLHFDCALCPSPCKETTVDVAPDGDHDCIRGRHR